MTNAPELVELRASERDIGALRRFYDGLYATAFPDPNERESLENMTSYLRGRGDRGVYHVVLAIDGARIAGGSISDYLTASRTGAIEFLVVDPGLRGAGLGSALLRRTEELLAADARARGAELRMIGAEIDDPLSAAAHRDGFDAFERAAFWSRRGYARADLAYVQPALSPEQRPVRHLMLAVKPACAAEQRALPAALVDAFLRDYLTYAMAIDPPERSPEYMAMAARLRGAAEVRLVALPQRADVLRRGRRTAKDAEVSP